LTSKHQSRLFEVFFGLSKYCAGDPHPAGAHAIAGVSWHVQQL
jgi:hypothetical protein